ncbi:hypothetical protein TNCV_2547411 [Trichonephila clavipes]|nr:hypothetical protein TNCV_2547411 [Trichonephila clavipes]
MNANQKKQCINNEQKTFTTLHQIMFHMTTTTGRRHSRRVTNPATAECNMSGCMEDTSLWIASSVPTDLMDRIDTREIFKYPHNQKSAGVKSETEEVMGTCSAC